MAVRTSATRLAVISQVGMYGLLFLCLVLKPHFLFERDEGGVSNFGLYKLTIVPYSLAFLIGGASLFLAARRLPSAIPMRVLLSRTLTLISVLLLCVLVSTYTYKVSAPFDEFHIAASVTLFLVEMASGIWFGVRYGRTTASLVILGVQCIGFVLSALTCFGVIDVLFVAQMITGIGFGWLLIKTVSTSIDQAS